MPLVSGCSWRRFNAARGLFYVALIPVFFRTGWIHSVTAVNTLSLIALAEACMAAWRSDVPTDRGAR